VFAWEITLIPDLQTLLPPHQSLIPSAGTTPDSAHHRAVQENTPNPQLHTPTVSWHIQVITPSATTTKLQTPHSTPGATPDSANDRVVQENIVHGPLGQGLANLRQKVPQAFEQQASGERCYGTFENGLGFWPGGALV